MTKKRKAPASGDDDVLVYCWYIHLISMYLTIRFCEREFEDKIGRNLVFVNLPCGMG